MIKSICKRFIGSLLGSSIKNISSSTQGSNNLNSSKRSSRNGKSLMFQLRKILVRNLSKEEAHNFQPFLPVPLQRVRKISLKPSLNHNKAVPKICLKEKNQALKFEKLVGGKGQRKEISWIVQISRDLKMETSKRKKTKALQIKTDHHPP